MTTVPNDNSTLRLSEISRILLKIHKSLLFVQKEIYEKSNQKNVTPQEFLNLTMNHESFAWLKIITDLIIKIDEAIDHKKSDFEVLLVEVSDKINELFFSNSEKSLRPILMKCLAKDSSLQIEFAALQAKLVNKK